MAYYVRRPQTPQIVEAEQVKPGSHIHPGQGVRPPRPGDWVLYNPSNGSVEVLTNDEFAAMYELAMIPPSTPSSVPENLAWDAQQQPPQPEQAQPEGLSWGAEPQHAHGHTETPADVPQVQPPHSNPGGAFEPFSPSGPSTPMNENLPGRPLPTPDIEPRSEGQGPVETITGQLAPKEEIQPEGPTSTEPLVPPDKEESAEDPGASPPA